MGIKGKLLRKALEAYPDAVKYYNELGRQIAWIEYERINVRGVRFDPDKVPNSNTGESRNTATIYTRQYDDAKEEQAYIRQLIYWVSKARTSLPPEDWALLEARYVQRTGIDTLADRFGVSHDTMKYRIDAIFRKI